MQTFQHWRGLRQGSPQPASTWSVSVSPSLCPVSSASVLGLNWSKYSREEPVWSSSMAQIIPLSQVPLWRKDGPSNQLDPGLKWKWGPLLQKNERHKQALKCLGPPLWEVWSEPSPVYLYDGESGRKRHTGVRHEWPLVPLGPTGFVIIYFV